MIHTAAGRRSRRLLLALPLLAVIFMGLACSAAAAGQEDAGKASKPEQPPPRPPPTSIPAMSIRMHAQRFAGESFPEFAARTMLGEAHKKKGDASEKNYVFNRLEPFRNAKNDKYAPTWPAEDAEKYAAAIRDERFLEDLDHPEFSRRISWLYPDDGCMVRAELVRMKAVERGLPMPAKVFSFGSLAVKSENAPVGEKHIYWGWHVAALVRVNGVLMAIDPSIEYEPMMPLQRWYDLQTQGPVAGPLEGASICHGYSYDPDSECEPSRPEPEEVVFDILDEDRYLGKEWRRQKSLGRDPHEVLGRYPPWVEAPEERPEGGAGPAALLRGGSRRRA